MAAQVLDLAPRGLFDHLDLSVEPFLKHDLALRLDTDAQLCPDWVQTHACPRGAHCPKRHVQPSPLNFQPPPPIPQSAHARTVCKHWLRGLCKKGTSCEFMHEYHLRKMPECWFFAKYGFCSNGDEVRCSHLSRFCRSLADRPWAHMQCMYLHVTEEMRIRECPRYRKGFCPDGSSSLSPSLFALSLTHLRPFTQDPNASSSTSVASSAPLTSSGSAPKAKTVPSGSASSSSPLPNLLALH